MAESALFGRWLETTWLLAGGHVWHNKTRQPRQISLAREVTIEDLRVVFNCHSPITLSNKTIRRDRTHIDHTRQFAQSFATSQEQMTDEMVLTPEKRALPCTRCTAAIGSHGEVRSDFFAMSDRPIGTLIIAAQACKPPSGCYRRSG
jgi:hypothetical protein